MVSILDLSNHTWSFKSWDGLELDFAQVRSPISVVAFLKVMRATLARGSRIHLDVVQVGPPMKRGLGQQHVFVRKGGRQNPAKRVAALQLDSYLPVNFLHSLLKNERTLYPSTQRVRNASLHMQVHYNLRFTSGYNL